MQIKYTLKIEQSELGIQPTESEWKRKIDRQIDMLCVFGAMVENLKKKCKKESTVSLGQRKVTLLLALLSAGFPMTVLNS